VWLKERCFEAVLLIALISGIVLELSTNLSAPSKRTADVLSPNLSLITSNVVAGNGVKSLSAPHPTSTHFYGKLPLSFEANQGQTDSQVQFLSRGKGYTLFLTKTEAVMQLPIGDFRLPIFDWKLRTVPTSDFVNPQPEIRNPQFRALRMKLVGSNPQPQIEGLGQLPGISNYFIGNDPKQWRTNIPNYSKVKYHNVYPGIDLAYYGNQGQVEYDLIVAPGVDPRVIKLAYEGVESMHLDDQGNLVLQVAGTTIRQHRPRIYQETARTRKEIPGRFVLVENHRVSFQIARYAIAEALVIDPVLSYATYLGGSEGDAGLAMAADSSGNTYLTGYTASANFPVTSGSFETTYPGGTCGGIPAGPCEHVFVSKLNATGTALIYSTYLGGTLPASNASGGDRSYGIALDAQGDAYITGATESLDFPTVNAIQPHNGGARDAFVTKLNATGSALLYSTYLGGSDYDGAAGIAVDQASNAYLVAVSSSTNFPSSNISHRVFGQGAGGYVLKLNATGSALTYSVVIADSNPAGVAVDNSGSVYLTGSAGPSFPTVNPFQTTPQTSGAFVAKLNFTGTELIYSSYLGGGDDFGIAIAVDTLGNAHVIGSTASPNFPTTPGAFQPSYEGFGEDTRSNFVTKVNSSGTALVYSTYLLSKQVVKGYEGAIAVDQDGNAYVVGSTSSADFPVLNPLQASFGGGVDPSDEVAGNPEAFDAFVVKFNPSGSMIFSTYLGGSRADRGSGIALDGSGDVHIAGSTASNDFPTSDPLQPSNGGTPSPSVGKTLADAFIVKISANEDVSLSRAGAAFNVEGGTNTVNITAPQGYAWTAVSHASWITVISGASGSGTGTVSFSVDPTSLNAGPRTGTLTIAGRVLTVTQDPNDIFVPAVVSASGVNNSFFTSELTLTNRGTQAATLEFMYTASSQFGGSGGTASDTLEAGHQRIVPDAIAYLRSLGIPIPSSGDRLGTLRIHILEVPACLVSATVRTTTAVAGGRSGLAYAGIPTSQALRGPARLCGLRQNSSDRSNVALQNAGTSSDGDALLQLTVFSGDLSNPIQQKLPLVRLAPGDSNQISGILVSNGLSLSNGYVQVERVGGVAPYYAYAVINDLANSDGSFISPQLEDEPVGNDPLTLPAVVESSSFVSELILTNWSSETKSIFFQYYAAAIETELPYAQFQMDLKPVEQSIIPNFVGLLRQHGVTGVQRVGPTYAGVLYVSPYVPLGPSEIVDAHGVCVGARTSSAGGGGRYGVFYSAVSKPRLSAAPVWLYGLQQNSESRSNVALVDTTGPESDPTNSYKIELFDGDTGTKVNTLTGIALESNQWSQINRILADYAPSVKQGYARVAPTGGSTPFIAYAVINDGGKPGERTGDGAFIASSP